MLSFNQWLNKKTYLEHRIPVKPMDIPEGIRRIHAAFKAAGFQLYIAGGAVRDYVLGEKPKDYDLATDATPQEVIKILDSNNIQRTEQVGEQFGVVIATIDDEPYEIATFRVDKEAGRDTEVEFVRDPKQDVLRRDLTMNALLYDLDKHEVIDYVGGVDDIKNNRVRVVGDPMERFGEDPLRVLRLIRFQSRFNRAPEGIDLPTQQAIAHFVQNNLTDKKGKSVPPERIRDEFKKGLAKAKVPVNYLKLYDKFGLLRKYVLPGFDKYNTNFINSNNPAIVIANILKTNKIDRDFEAKLKAALHENDDVALVLYYLKMLNLKRGRKLFSKLGVARDGGNKPIAGREDDEDLLVNLIRKKPDISDEELAQWARWHHMPLDMVKRFRDYQYKSKVSDIPGATDLPPGKAMGSYVKGYNTWKALQSLGKMPDFKEWFNLEEGLFTDLDNLSVGGKKVLLKSLLRRGAESPEQMGDNELFQVMQLFQNLTNKHPVKVGGSPYGLGKAEFFKRLYDALMAMQPVAV